MPLLKDEDPKVRWRAALACQKVGAPAAGHLIRTLEEGEHQAKPPAIWALEHIGDKRAIEPLIRSLATEHTWTRWMAMAALIKLGDPKGVAAAREALRTRTRSSREIVEELVEGS